MTFSVADRYSRHMDTLKADEELALARAELVRLVRRVVAESGDLEGFDAERWTAKWLGEQVPALGWRTPAEFMRNQDTRHHVFDLILRMQAGTYC